MSVSEFEKIAQIVSPMTNAICLHLMGEPLLHPNINEIFAVCNKYNLKVYLTTNGTLLKQKLGLLSSGCCKRISISLHSFEANQSKILLEEYLQNIFDSSIEITKNANTYVEFRLWNKSNQPATTNHLNTKIVDKINEYFGTNIDLLQNQKRNDITNQIYLNVDDLFEWPINSQQEQKNDVKFCYGLRSHFGILSDGTVVACCLDNEGKLALGNIFDTDINVILSSPRAQNIAKGFSKHTAQEDFCKTCDYANKFLQ